MLALSFLGFFVLRAMGIFEIAKTKKPDPIFHSSKNARVIGTAFELSATKDADADGDVLPLLEYPSPEQEPDWVDPLAVTPPAPIENPYAPQAIYSSKVINQPIFSIKPFRAVEQEEVESEAPAPVNAEPVVEPDAKPQTQSTP